MRIDLEEQHWRQVLAVLATGPWRTVNGLIMEIGRQMQAQTPGAQAGMGGLQPSNQAGAQRGNGADPDPDPGSA